MADTTNEYIAETRKRAAEDQNFVLMEEFVLANRGSMSDAELSNALALAYGYGMSRGVAERAFPFSVEFLLGTNAARNPSK